MIELSTLIKHYKRKDIQNAILANAQDREIAIKFGDKGFGKRPDIIKYPRDILELALQGATSFHGSEELWTNPLLLNPNMRKKEMEEIRKGWDLVLDIDSDFLEFSKIAADVLVNALEYHGVKSTSCKFSGRAGFHIGIPFEAFPETVNGKSTKLLFPDGARAIAYYLKEMIRAPLESALLKQQKLDGIMKATGKKFEDVVEGTMFNPFSILNIDTVLISSRHLYRMPYSFNEKSGLVSIPVDPFKIREFDIETAKPKNVKVSKFKFLNKKNVKKDEARKLLIQAFDFITKRETEKLEKEERWNIAVSLRKQGKDFEIPQQALPAELFPPCIKKILKGLDDGRKRSVFILINFLSSVGWDYEAMEKLLREWNQRNKEALREAYWLGQLRYHRQQKKKILPPNCLNRMYYIDLQLCNANTDDAEYLCRRIKNPVNYCILRGKSLQGEKNKKKKKQAKQVGKEKNMGVNKETTKQQ